MLLLDVLEILTIPIHDDLGGVIKVHSSRPIGKKISQTVFSGIVHPFLHMHLSALILLQQLFLLDDWLHIVGTDFAGRRTRVGQDWLRPGLFDWFGLFDWGLDGDIGGTRFDGELWLTRLGGFQVLISEVFGRRASEGAPWHGPWDGLSHKGVTEYLLKCWSLGWV